MYFNERYFAHEKARSACSYEQRSVSPKYIYALPREEKREKRSVDARACAQGTTEHSVSGTILNAYVHGWAATSTPESARRSS